jgi:hypothetical protein
MMVAMAALALVLAGCGPQVGDTTFVVSSDPDLKERVGQLLPELAERAGMELTRPLRVERRSREQLEGYLRAKLDEEFPPVEADLLTRSYSLLGLIDGDLDLRSILLSVYTEQVAGFYEPDSTALFVMDDMALEMQQTVLVHELVHAVQDQTANLDSLTAKVRGNDRQSAAQAAIEGHATLVMLEYVAEQLRGEPVDFSQLPDFSSALRPALEGMRNQYPALASAPAIIQEALLFPYLEGASFMAALWQADQSRPAPFGANLPQSTEQVLDPAKAGGESWDPPTELRLTPQGAHTVAYENTMGQAELRVFLEEHLGVEAKDLAQGWDGDRYLLLLGPEGHDALVWASVWDTEEARDRFVEGLRPALPQMEVPGSLEAVPLFGRPGALLVMGTAGEVPVLVEEGVAR